MTAALLAALLTLAPVRPPPIPVQSTCVVWAHLVWLWCYWQFVQTDVDPEEIVRLEAQRCDDLRDRFLGVCELGGPYRPDEAEAVARRQRRQ